MPTQTEARGTKLMIGAAFMSAGNIIRFGLQLVMLPILGRMLGPHVYGLASFAMPLISLASLVSDTGLSNAVAGGAEMSVLIESNIFWVSVVSGGAVCAAGLPDRRTDGLYFRTDGEIVNAATTLLNGLIIRRHKFWAFMVGDILSFLLSSLIAITLALSGFGIWSLVAQMLVLTSVKFVWLFSVSRPAIILHMKPSEIRGLISFGLDVVGPAAFLALIWPRLRAGRAERGVGLLGAAIALAATPFLPPGVPVILAAIAALAAALAAPGPAPEPAPR